MSIEILYEDRWIIVVKKPAGLATQTAKVAEPDCVSLIKEHIRKSDPSKSSEPYVGVVHRLDQPVAGLLVFAKDKDSAAALSRQVSGGLMNKHYHAVVEGIVDSPDDTELTDYMYKDPKTSKAVIVDDPLSGNADLRKATLIYHTEKIQEQENQTILSISLVTGRFHQIRSQMSHMGHPIVGDRKYGSSAPYPNGIALVADSLTFIHPHSGEKVEKAVDFSFFL
ncbi:MAG: RluA family pseudouridine synthase [Lachnospiraceae bacterium]|nr:RluA family pseudouridine synthase [Lachnospiraceae bacterium]